MPILSPKRQVTIPKELCDRLRVQPGDDLDMLEHDGRITILKKVKGSSAGVVKHLRPDRRYSETQSREDALEQRRGARRRASS
jgi:AbrB family looped-hinge helix DNA binding protein